MLESLFKSWRTKPCNIIKKRLQHRCFPLNIAKFLKTAFLEDTSGGCFWFFVFNLKKRITKKPVEGRHCGHCYFVKKIKCIFLKLFITNMYILQGFCDLSLLSFIEIKEDREDLLKPQLLKVQHSFCEKASSLKFNI